MISSCPTTQHIHAMAAVAAGMGEPSCETIIDGVRITVHVPFEGPLNRSLAHQWIKPRARFRTMNSFLFMTGIEDAPANWEEQLNYVNGGGGVPCGRTNIFRALIIDRGVHATEAGFQTHN